LINQSGTELDIFISLLQHLLAAKLHRILLCKLLASMVQGQAMHLVVPFYFFMAMKLFLHLLPVGQKLESLF
jgi:hypothetical protein